MSSPSTAFIPRKCLLYRVLPPLNNTHGRRTGWKPPAWGTVALDEHGVEDMGAFFEELRPRSTAAGVCESPLKALEIIVRYKMLQWNALTLKIPCNLFFLSGQ